MSSHLPYSSYVNRTSSTSKYGTPSSYSRTSSAPSSNTNSLERSSRSGSYGSSPSRAGSTTYGRYASAPRGYSVEPERAKSPERRVGGLRMGSSSRFGAQIARSPISEKSPTVFGVAPRDDDKLQLVTRGTSPTPPSNSSFLREKRANLDKTLIEFVPRPGFRPVCLSSEAQTEVKAPTPPPPAVVENPRLPPTSRWGSRSVTPRYSSSGGYAYVRREEKPAATSRYGGLGFKPEQAQSARPKTPSPTRETVSKLHKSPSKQLPPEAEHTIPPLRTDPIGNVNKDFRKSILNMDLKTQEPPKSAIPTIKSRSNLKLTLNKSQTTTSINGKSQPSKKEESSSSDETTSSEDDSSSDESDDTKLKPPDPKSSPRTSNDERTLPQSKPPASPKAVLVKTLNAASPMKVQFSPESSNDEARKPYGLRKFDSGVKEWWQESHKDIPAAAEAHNQPSKNSSKVEIPNIKLTKSPSKVVVEKGNDETQGYSGSDSKGFKLRKFDSGERSWWMESNKDIPGIDKKQKGLVRAPSKDKLSGGSSANSGSEDKMTGLSKLKNSSSKVDLTKTGSSSSVSASKSESDSKSIGLNRLYNSGSKTDLSKSLSSSTASLNTALQSQSESDSRSLGISKLYGSKSDLSKSSGCSLSRAPSAKTLRPPEAVRRSDVLDPPTEFTPGLLRLHGQWTRPLPRVESGLREWWLDEEEEAARARPVGGYSGPFADIDHYLGNAAPPPAAFRTPNTSDDDSDSSDDGWYKKVVLKNQQNGTVNGEKKVRIVITHIESSDY